jgi:hypothetical protein
MLDKQQCQYANIMKKIFEIQDLPLEDRTIPNAIISLFKIIFEFRVQE